MFVNGGLHPGEDFTTRSQFLANRDAHKVREKATTCKQFCKSFVPNPTPGLSLARYNWVMNTIYVDLLPARRRI
jgi:hypothetical protein